MVFRRKKNKPENSTGAAVLRGRDSVDPESNAGSDTNPLARRFVEDDEPDTIDLEEPARFQNASDERSGESTTRLLSGDEEPILSSADALENPVTGFLVVVAGPGRGSVAHLGYGMNAIGRDAEQSVSLDYGDLQISRNAHCLITYDTKSAVFYIQPGEGRSLTYLDDQPVLVPSALTNGQQMQLGETTLRFIALCGESFDWGSNPQP